MVLYYGVERLGCAAMRLIPAAAVRWHGGWEISDYLWLRFNGK